VSVQLAFWLLVVFCLAVYAVLARSAPDEVAARRQAEAEAEKRRRAEARARIVERRPAASRAGRRRSAPDDSEPESAGAHGSAASRPRAATVAPQRGAARPPFPFALPFKLPFKLKWPFARRRRRRFPPGAPRPTARRRR